MASRFANTMKAAGLKAGDRLAVQVEKSAEALAIYAACVQRGDFSAAKYGVQTS